MLTWGREGVKNLENLADIICDCSLIADTIQVRRARALKFAQLNQNTTTTHRNPRSLIIRSINELLPKLRGGWPKSPLSPNINTCQDTTQKLTTI